MKKTLSMQVALTVALAVGSTAPGGAAERPQWRAVIGPRMLDLEAPTAARSRADTAALARLGDSRAPEGRWGGPGCAPLAQLLGMVDTYLATPHSDFPDLGPAIPGLSMSWSSPRCGAFQYAAGLRNVDDGKPLKPSTPMGIASMTKPIIAALTLMLDERGAFGPRGLDTTVDRLLTPRQIQALTVGEDPANPACPGSTFLNNRTTGAVEWTHFSCPDLSQVTLRHLMVSNHGMYDFLNEDYLPSGLWAYGSSIFSELYEAFGLSPKPPANARNGFGQLKSYGLKRNDSAVIGGNLFSDLEPSFGNTGFQLLGVILEQRTRRTLDDLIDTMIVRRLDVGEIRLYLDAKKQRNKIADGYDIWTGDPDIEGSGVYPLSDVNGHTALNSLSLGLGLPANVNLAGGAGGLITDPKSYRVFLDAFVNGRLLGPRGRAQLEASYVLLPEATRPTSDLSNGFGLVRERLRGFADFPHMDLLFHGGSLPGVLCNNMVIRPVDPALLSSVGVICQNANLGADPALNSLMRGILLTVTAPAGSAAAAGPVN
jgi:CubicO group peptidase (beta-lactamase class C family)